MCLGFFFLPFFCNLLGGQIKHGKMRRGRWRESEGEQRERRWWDERRFRFAPRFYFVYSRSSHIWHVPRSILRSTKFAFSLPLTVGNRTGASGAGRACTRAHTCARTDNKTQRWKKYEIRNKCVVFSRSRSLTECTLKQSQSVSQSVSMQGKKEEKRCFKALLTRAPPERWRFKMKAWPKIRCQLERNYTISVFHSAKADWSDRL